MLVSAIVAVAHNNIIGHDNQIPWYLPADLAYFKRKTLNRHIIMGRNTWHSIGRPLPKRVNIVLTKDLFFAAEGAFVVHTLEEALELAYDGGETEVFIIGGGEIYRQSAPLWDRIYLTEVDVTVPGTVTFPAINPEEWQEIMQEKHQSDEKNEYDYTFRILERKNS